MKKLLLFFPVLIFGMMPGWAQQAARTIQFQAEDGLTVTADLYTVNDPKAPFIILYHQARYSRGEYLEIAPKLNMMGFNCLAVDQRSGDVVNGVTNATHQAALELGKNTSYVDAYPDLEAALIYVRTELKNKKIVVWGSSYSSALVFVLAAKNPDEVKAILSFSPGDYFNIDGKSVADFSAQVKCPVFITSARSEEPEWRPIFARLSHAEKYFYLPDDEGFHGSKALWEKNKGYDAYWTAVETFLGKLSF